MSEEKYSGERRLILTIWAVSKVNAALTAVLSSMVTVQSPVPEHGVPHPEKYEYIAGLAWSVTKVPQVNCPEHPVLQTTPAGLLTMVPLPVPVGVTVRVSSPVGWPERTGQTKPSNGSTRSPRRKRVTLGTRTACSPQPEQESSSAPHWAQKRSPRPSVPPQCA